MSSEKRKKTKVKLPINSSIQYFFSKGFLSVVIVSLYKAGNGQSLN